MSSKVETSLEDPIELNGNMHWQRTQKHLINTPLQRGDRQCYTPATALAVSKCLEETAEAVPVRVDVISHLAEARC